MSAFEPAATHDDGRTPAELAPVIGVSVGSADVILRDFAARGITVESDGRWRLTERGQEVARGLADEGDRP